MSISHRSDLLWGHYRNLGQFASGGMAEIHEVIDVYANKKYAAKIIRRDRLYEEVIRRQFQHEMSLHPTLIHPAIVRCWEAHPETDPPGIIMDYIGGRSLRDRLPKKRQTIGGSQASPLTTDEIMTVVDQMTSALEYLHNMGWVHCDIKPDNILTDNQGNYYLTDFGIAHRIGYSLESKRGTPKYMAPEQYQKLPVSPQTDIYALGITLYELLTNGEVPFSENAGGSGTEFHPSSGSHESLENQHMYRPPVSPSFYNPRIRPEIDNIILRTLEKDPSRRYPNVRGLYDDLQRIQRNQSRSNISMELGMGSFSQVRSNIPRALLICTRPNRRQGEQVNINEQVQIGRLKSSDLRFRNDQISRRHAMVRWDPNWETFVVFDQGSKLGTRVNGHRLAPDVRRPLNTGDLLTIGDYNFRFELEANR